MQTDNDPSYLTVNKGTKRCLERAVTEAIREISCGPTWIVPEAVEENQRIVSGGGSKGSGGRRRLELGWNAPQIVGDIYSTRNSTYYISIFSIFRNAAVA